MVLDEIVAAQKRGEARGIASVCSAHPAVLAETLRVSKAYGAIPLIEATCNQVNQFGGYTGMTPVDFVNYVRAIAKKNRFQFEKVLLGGDHLGPNVWQDKPSSLAMEYSQQMVRDYVQAGFLKIHLDCSMRLDDDPRGTLDTEIIAVRAATLAKVAEEYGDGNLRYVIGTEVPVPGGAAAHEVGVSVTRVGDARQTIEIHRRAFEREGLGSAWERVIALVVQPGVEFGDDFVLPYIPAKARKLSRFIEGFPLVLEAHSTDYQTQPALKDLVRDHFAILKVGPALTFAFREAVYALAMIEDEMLPRQQRSNIIQALDDEMMRNPAYWEKYFHGDEAEQAFKRKYSLSDRARYYWVQPSVQVAYAKLMKNLAGKHIPYSLLSQFVGRTDLNSEQVIGWKIGQVLQSYMAACGAGAA
jgi:D-tagatose-1,6-bisphosphate aldolase subunit GatZ/KbaZ